MQWPEKKGQVMTEKFIDSILEKENALYKELERCRENGHLTYILGGGWGRQLD